MNKLTTINKTPSGLAGGTGGAVQGRESGKSTRKLQHNIQNPL